VVALAVPASLAAGASPASAAKAPVTGVTGVVTSAATSKPLAGICINVVEASSNHTVGTSKKTSKTGVWKVTGIPASTDYTAIAGECTKGDYIPQWYDGQAFQTNATQFAVTAGATTTAINFSLTLGGAVSGTVTDAATKQPVAGILVVAYYTSAFQTDSAVCTTDKGTYSIAGLTTSGVKVGFYANDCGATTPAYPDTYYKNATSYDTGTVVAITANKTTKNINQALTSGSG